MYIYNIHINKYIYLYLNGKISKDFPLIQNKTKMSPLTTPFQYCPIVLFCQ